MNIRWRRIWLLASVSLLSLGVPMAGDVARADVTKLSFKCGGNGAIVIDVPGRRSIGGRLSGAATARGSACKDLIAKKDSLCAEKLGATASDAAKRDAQREAQGVCENIVRQRVEKGYAVSCEEQSRNSCSNPAECAPIPFSSGLCPLPELTGAEQLKATVLPYEVGGYGPEDECSLFCFWELGTKGVKVRVPMGCANCQQINSSVTISSTHLE